jgi:hypothetical protein
MNPGLPDAASFLGVGDYLLWRSRRQKIQADQGVCNNAWDSTSTPGELADQNSSRQAPTG